ncbi:MAG: DUF2231 domain-containing protein [Ignavibacteriae bacterium]|nr:DUF2231 domain-containing protein [Ignavibacteriota bacterium]
MPNIHPFLVHFPIALLTVSFLADLAATLTRNEDLHKVGWWTLLLGTLGLAASVVTGLLAESTITIPREAKEFFEVHEQIGFIVSAIFIFLFLWRIASRTHLPTRNRIWFHIFSLIGVILIWMGAWYGGEMVYRFGVGVGVPPQ